MLSRPVVRGKRRAALEFPQRHVELPERMPRAAVHPERGEALRLLRAAEPLEGGDGLVERAGRFRVVRRGHPSQHAARQCRGLEDRISDRTSIVARVAGLGAGLAGVAIRQSGQGERKAEADPIRRWLCRQFAERHLEPAPRFAVAAQPPLRVCDPDGQAQPLACARGPKRLQQRLASCHRVARGRLGIGEQTLQLVAPLPSLRPVGQESQGGGVEPRGGGRGRGLQLAGRCREQPDGVLVARTRRVLDVVRALDRPGALTFQRVRGAGMGAEAPAGRGRLVHGVTDHRVAKGEAARRARLAHQRAAQQLVERFQRFWLGELSNLGSQGRLERIAGHRRRVEQPPRRLGQRRQLGRHGGRDRGRDEGFRRDAGGRSRLAADASELFEVERVAAALGIDRGGGLADQLGGFGAAERGQGESGGALLAERVGQRRGQARSKLSLAGRHRRQHRSVGGPADQRRQCVDRRAVGPVHVVQAQHERTRFREPAQQVAQRPVGAVAVGGGRWPAGLRERRDHGAQPAAVGQSKARQLALAEPRHVIVQGFGPERERQIRLELRGPGAQNDAPALRCGVRQVSEQPRLADSRLALDREERPRPAPSASSNPATASRSAARPTSPGCVIAEDATPGRPPPAG